MIKLIRIIYFNTILKMFEKAFIWRFRLKYGINSRRWERLCRRHPSILHTILGWEMRCMWFNKKKRYEDYTNFLTHKQKIELIEKDNE